MSARVAVAGGPQTGKTTLGRALAARLGAPLRQTDDLIPLGWSEASAAAATWFDAPGPYVAEGVAVGRALRKWLAAHPDGRPVDLVVYLTEPQVELTPGQRSMWKGCATVWAEIVGELRARGVDVVEVARVAADDLPIKVPQPKPADDVVIHGAGPDGSTIHRDCFLCNASRGFARAS